MKTLHKIFFKKYLKEWVLITGIGMIVLVVFYSLVLLDTDSSLGNIMLPISVFYAIFGPIIHATFTNNEFQENLSWLINFQFNRKELLKFYFSIQTIKTLLVFLSYALFIFSAHSSYALLSDKTTKAKESSESLFTSIFGNIESWANISTLFFTLLAAIYLIYFASLFKANSEDVRRHQIKLQSLKYKKLGFKHLSSKEKQTRLLYFAVAIIATFIIIKGNTFGFYFLAASAFAAFGVGIFNRQFKVLTLKKENVFSGVAFASIAFIFSILYFASTTDIANRRIDLEARVDSLIYTKGFYTPKYQDLKDIIQMAKQKENTKLMGKVMDYAGDKDLPFKYLMPIDLKFKQTKGLLAQYLDWRRRSSYTSEIINFSQYYAQKNELTKKDQIVLAGIVRRLKIKRIEILDLIKQENFFSQALGVLTAKKYMSKRRYRTIISAHYEQLDPEIKKLGSVKRSIASFDDSKDQNKDNKKKDEYQFSYDDF